MDELVALVKSGQRCACSATSAIRRSATGAASPRSLRTAHRSLGEGLAAAAVLSGSSEPAGNLLFPLQDLWNFSTFAGTARWGSADACESLGYIAAFLVFLTFSMKTMVPLRIVGIASNVFFIAYGYLHPAYPLLILHAALLPLNMFRLRQMLVLVRQVEDATKGDLNMNWLKPFTHTRQAQAGDVISAKARSQPTWRSSCRAGSACPKSPSS